MKNKSNSSGRHKLDPETARGLHLSYIEKRWEVVAAVAWKEYQAHCRGALLFTASADPGGEWDCKYLALDLIKGHPLTEEYSKMVRYWIPRNNLWPCY